MKATDILDRIDQALAENRQVKQQRMQAHVMWLLDNPTQMALGDLRWDEWTTTVTEDDERMVAEVESLMWRPNASGLDAYLCVRCLTDDVYGGRLRLPTHHRPHTPPVEPPSTQKARPLRPGLPAVLDSEDYVDRINCTAARVTPNASAIRLSVQPCTSCSSITSARRSDASRVTCCCCCFNAPSTSRSRVTRSSADASTIQR